MTECQDQLGDARGNFLACSLRTLKATSVPCLTKGPVSSDWSWRQIQTNGGVYLFSRGQQPLFPCPSDPSGHLKSAPPRSLTSFSAERLLSSKAVVLNHCRITDRFENVVKAMGLLPRKMPISTYKQIPEYNLFYSVGFLFFWFMGSVKPAQGLQVKKTCSEDCCNLFFYSISLPLSSLLIFALLCLTSSPEKHPEELGNWLTVAFYLVLIKCACISCCA